MKKKESILTNQLEEIFLCKDLESARDIFNKLVQESKLTAHTKAKMLLYAGQCRTLIEMQTYATNSCFKFNGLGVV